ncbi:deoxynucleotidyltransferase terminal-interacting protein 1-like [Ciona intestinalis]
MVDVFTPGTYCSKTFWPPSDKPPTSPIRLVRDGEQEMQQPFTTTHLEQPHTIRYINGHLGASPVSRANVTSSMDLLLKVLQPAINSDVMEMFHKYIEVFREGAENAAENMNLEPFKSVNRVVDVDALVSRACMNALENAKKIFRNKNSKPSKPTMDNWPPNLPPTIPSHVLPGKRRVASPDWTKRLKVGSSEASQRRSLSPIPKKRPRTNTPTAPMRSYGSPHRNTKEAIKRKVESWDPSRLNINAKFVMGTKANRALGLGATRGRIYMKHPDLFKYVGDHEDKKWMVKNNCMAATGGKNTFILLADDVMNLYDTEYKDSPGTMPEELQFFGLPEFVLQKMRSAMMREKKLRTGVKDVGSPMTETTQVASPHRNVRHAAQMAAAAISAASSPPGSSTTITTQCTTRTKISDTDSEDSYEDNGSMTL